MKKRPSFLAKYGAKILANGYPIVPIKPGTKYPGYAGWQHTEADDALLDMWLSGSYADYGVGILAKTCPALDIDVYDPEIASPYLDWCVNNLPVTAIRVGFAPKTLLVFKTSKPFPKMSSATYVDFLGMKHKVEILGDGQQFVAFAIHPDTGKPYEWTSDVDPANLPYDKLGDFTVEDAQRAIDAFEAMVPEDWTKVERAPSSLADDPDVPAPERALAHAKPRVDISTSKIRRALDYLDADMNMREWVRVGMALYHQFDGAEEGFELWDAWSSQGAKYNRSEMRTRWRSFKPDLRNTNPVTVATVLAMAKAEHVKGVRPKADGGSGGGDDERDNRFKFQLVPVGEVLDSLGPIEWLIEDYIEDNTTGLLFGDPEAGKSFLALDMALCVATGRPWQGHAVQQGPAVYIAGEGHNGLARRIAAWEKDRGVDMASVPLYVSKRAAAFYDAESAADVVEAVKGIAEELGEAPRFVVIDTLARNFGGGDENSNTDMGVFLNHVDGMLRAEFRCAVMLVHHTGHTHKERARGATALNGGMDFALRLERVGAGLTTHLTATKMKDAPKPDGMWLEGREVVIGEHVDDAIKSLVFDKGEPPVTEEKPLRGKQAALYQVIAKEAPVSRDSLRTIVMAEGIFDNPDTFKNALAQLRKKGVVVENDTYITTEDDFLAGDSPEKTEISGASPVDADPCSKIDTALKSNGKLPEKTDFSGCEKSDVQPEKTGISGKPKNGG